MKIEIEADIILNMVTELDDILFELARIESKQNGSPTLNCPLSDKATRKIYKIGNFVLDQMKKEQEEE